MWWISGVSNAKITNQEQCRYLRMADHCKIHNY